MDTISLFFHKAVRRNEIDNTLYKTYDVKKGLRNEDGTGVLIGLTQISDVVGYEKKDGKKVDCPGKLYYRGIDVKEIVNGNKGRRYLFEEVCFLILFGYLPDIEELEEFKKVLREHYELPTHFLQSNILGLPAKNVMNKLQQEVLMMYNYDESPEDISAAATLEKGLNLIAKIPSMVCYTYASKVHYFDNQSLIVHQINPELSIAEMILSLLRPDSSFTPTEAEVLDLCLCLHADHGGGNNSTFTSVVISSTGTDLYSSIAGSIGSLKGPRHGGANLAVRKQMNAVVEKIGTNPTDEKIHEIVCDILDKKFGDGSGLIYGIGHAVYTLSDPRSEILCSKAFELARETNRIEEFEFYQRFAMIASEELSLRKGINVCTNVDFYSGLVYDMLGIPTELFTLLFVIGRTVGWVAHTIETRLYADRIIRPASKYVGEITNYTELEKRD